MEDAKPVDSQPEDEDDHRCGWGRLKSPQCLNRPAWFLFFLSVSLTLQSMTLSGLTGVTITSIERRFDMTSTQAGWIRSAYEVAGLPVLLVVGYLGGSGIHRPRWIAGGMFILSLGALLYSLPHFITGPYISGNNVLQLTCRDNTNSSADNCAKDVSTSLSNYQYIFISSTVLIAIGAVPIYVLGVPYMYDALTKEQSSLFLGIFYSFAVVGPAIGFVAGGLILNAFYTDFDTIDSSTIEFNADDPRWVGAWWVGFLFCFVISLLVVFPLSAFPYKLPCKADLAGSKSGEVQYTGKEDEDETVQRSPGTSLKDMPKALRILFRNMPFLFICLQATSDAIMINGVSSFGPKYLENAYGTTAGTASIIFGAIAVPGGAGGTLFGSYLIKRLQLTCSQLLKAIFISGILVMALVFGFAAQCDNVRFAGVTEPYVAGESMNGLESVCSGDCRCSKGSFEPVCGVNSITYFSPCFAGCRSGVSHNGVQTYAYCSCIENVSSEWNSTAVEGLCPYEGCVLMPLFVTLIFFAIFIMAMCNIFKPSIILRCVPQSQRSLALSIDWMLERGLGSMPGPLLFGVVLDKSCLLWSQKCEETGSCLYYDTHKMGWSLMGVCLGCKLLSVLFGLIAWRTYKPSIKGSQHTDTKIESNPAKSDTHILQNGTNCTKTNGMGDVNQAYNSDESTRL